MTDRLERGHGSGLDALGIRDEPMAEQLKNVPTDELDSTMNEFEGLSDLFEQDLTTEGGPTAMPMAEAFGVQDPQTILTQGLGHVGGSYDVEDEAVDGPVSTGPNYLSDLDDNLQMMEEQVKGLLGNLDGGEKLHKDNFMNDMMQKMGFKPPLSFEQLVFLFSQKTDHDEQNRVSGLLKDQEQSDGDARKTGGKLNLQDLTSGGKLGGNQNLQKGAGGVKESGDSDQQKMQMISYMMNQQQELQKLISQILEVMHSAKESVIGNIR